MKPPDVGYEPVRILMLYLTEDCNLRCTYCFVDKKARKMSSETARKSVAWFLDRNISGAQYEININFFGGEPFLELDRMEEVIAFAREGRPNLSKRVSFGATTNGTYANSRVERVIRDGRLSLLISLDGGAHAGRYRPFVSGKSSYELVARNLPLLSNWSPHATVRMTFHPDTLDLVGNVEEALALGARSIGLCPVQEADWQSHEEALNEAYDRLADWYIERVRKGDMPPLEVTNILLKQHHAVLHGSGRPARPCGVGTSLIGVDPDGNVMPCHRFLYRPADWLGTVDRPAFSEKRDRYVHLFSKQMAACATCMAEPVCGGGCRVVALNAGLGLEDVYPPYCITMRAHARAVYRIYETLAAEASPLLKHIVSSPRRMSASITELITT